MTLRWKGDLSGVGPAWGPVLSREALAPTTRNWNKLDEKEFSPLFLSIFLKCIYVSYLLQCFIVEVFWVFI